MRLWRLLFIKIKINLKPYFTMENHRHLHIFQMKRPSMIVLMFSSSLLNLFISCYGGGDGRKRDLFYWAVLVLKGNTSNSLFPQPFWNCRIIWSNMLKSFPGQLPSKLLIIIISTKELQKIWVIFRINYDQNIPMILLNKHCPQLDTELYTTQCNSQHFLEKVVKCGRIHAEKKYTKR